MFPLDVVADIRSHLAITIAQVSPPYSYRTVADARHLNLAYMLIPITRMSTYSIYTQIQPLI
jgi:hypothetical protein